MKKIILEAIGNSIMVTLFAATLIEIYSTNAQYTADGSSFTTGTVSIVFLVYSIIFSISRWLLSKKDKSYSVKDGEFSAADEREKHNAYFASIVSYKSMITSLLVALVVFVSIHVFSQPPFVNQIDLFTSGIILFALVICIGFLSYGTAWIFKDTR